MFFNILFNITNKTNIPTNKPTKTSTGNIGGTFSILLLSNMMASCNNLNDKIIEAMIATNVNNSIIKPLVKPLYALQINGTNISMSNIAMKFLAQ